MKADEIYQKSPAATYVMAACHSLSNIEREVVGDPMETAAVDAINWSYSSTPAEICSSRNKDARGTLKIRHRYNTPILLYP